MTITELTAPVSRTSGEMLEETLPLVGVIPVAGPPIALVAAPWLFVGLMLAGPFALLFTVVVVLVAAWAVVWLIRVILTAPFRLFRDLQRDRAGHLSTSTPAAHVLAGASR
jgi:hypothetical protein